MANAPRPTDLNEDPADNTSKAPAPRPPQGTPQPAARQSPNAEPHAPQPARRPCMRPLIRRLLARCTRAVAALAISCAIPCAIGLTLNLALPPAAHAGQACTDKTPSPDAIRKGLALALKTRQALDASGAQVALVARVGQDLSRYGLRYSHMAWAWRDHPKGRWFVVHELNQCGTALSDIYDEGLGNFFLDDLFAYEALILIPNKETQARLATQLTRERATALHQPRYSMVAYSYSTRYQNSNQWALETLAAALAPAGTPQTRETAQAWLKQNGFAPTTLNIGTFTRLGGRLFRANIAFDDHPDDRRYAGKIDTTTVEGVVGFLEGRGKDTKKILVN